MLKQKYDFILLLELFTVLFPNILNYMSVYN